MRVQYTTIETEKYFQSQPMLLEYLKQQLPRALYSIDPTEEGLLAYAAGRPFSAEKRASLVQVLRQQYAPLPDGEAALENIAALAEENTYTVCSGHQLCLLGGPLYIAYKIIGAINLARQLTEKSGGRIKVVPVFWLASEDHDVDEIASVNVFGKNFRWPTQQRGAVGRFELGEDFSTWLESIPQVPQWMKDLNRQGQTLAQFQQALIHHWFGSEGLVIIDADDPRLKQYFTPKAELELRQGIAAKGLQSGGEALELADFKPRLEVPAGRSIFYLQQGRRRRLVPAEEGWFTLGQSNDKIDYGQLREELNSHPENFSPDVALRPVYQEVVLPNLAYLGGPAEVGYWLQLKPVFDAAGVPMPAILLRPHLTLLTPPLARKAARLPLSLEELLLLPVEEAEQRLAPVAGEGQATGFSWLEQEFARLFDRVKQQALSLEPGLGNYIEAEVARLQPQVEKVARKLEKRSDELAGALPAAYHGLREKLLPGGKPQERTDSFYSYFLNYPDLIPQIMAAAVPFQSAHVILPLVTTTDEQGRTEETSARPPAHAKQ